MCLILIPTFLLIACSNVEKYEHVEVFVVETMDESKSEIPYETTGYKKVNAITNMEEGKNYIKADIKSIEDFYDVDGNYTKTEIIHSYATTSNVTNVTHGDNLKEVLQEPTTILIPTDEKGPFRVDDLTEEQKEQVKNYVQSYTDKLKKK